MTAIDFILKFKNTRFNFQTEKQTQAELEQKLLQLQCIFDREPYFDEKNIPDFFFPETGLCVEIKIKGGRKQIYKQLERYSNFDQVKHILLMTNKSMLLPAVINQKPTSILNMGKAWL